MYAAGFSSRDVVALCREVDWDLAFSPRSLDLWDWRHFRMPSPWLRLDNRSGKLSIPSGLLDDSAVNFMLSSELLPCDALARGNFDLLRVPLRVVATDLNTMTPVPLRSGSVAKAVRASIGLPVFFPPIDDYGRVLADGGFSSNTPIHAAREPGIDHVLAVDVAMPQPLLTAASPAALVGVTMLDRLNKRGQFDTLRVGDGFVWLAMPGISASDFGGVDTMYALGYQGSRTRIAQWADSLGLERAPADPPEPDPVLPPLAGSPEFLNPDGTPSHLGDLGRKLLGPMPAGSFRPDTLLPGLTRLYRAALFTSAWPQFLGNADSTRLVFEVLQEPQHSARFAAAADNDRGARAHASLWTRPAAHGLPSLSVLGLTVRNYDWDVFGSLEPHALERGSPGWFARGGFRRSMTRIFTDTDELTRRYGSHGELLVGGQLLLPRDARLSAGLGWGGYYYPDHDQTGAQAAVELAARRWPLRSLTFTAMSGADHFASTSAYATVSQEWFGITFAPSLWGGWASNGTPLMELPGLGGPSRLGGFREDEWLGQHTAGGEMRVGMSPSPFLELHGALQLGTVHHAVSRADLEGRTISAAVIGVELAIPFGPLTLDYGATEDHVTRFDIRFGPWF
jgi:predicted acylesterase/phospholipase RssA